jgi:predicted phosphodiesterase
MKIGIITDIHENTSMLRKVLDLAEEHGCDELACLGDIVGYDSRFYGYRQERSARECVRLVKASCKWVVAGNHDLFASRRYPEYTNGFKYPSDWFLMEPSGRKSASAGKVWSYEYDEPNDLEDQDLEFIRSLPESVTAVAGGVSCMFSHYIYPDLSGSTTRYVERNGQICQAWEFLERNNVRYSFSGHSHQLFAGFAYKSPGRMLKAVHPIPDRIFNLGDEPVIIILPPLSGEKGRTGFSIADTVNRKVSIITAGLS